jgi:hypothetical protein
MLTETNLKNKTWKRVILLVYSMNQRKIAQVTGYFIETSGMHTESHSI